MCVIIDNQRGEKMSNKLKEKRYAKKYTNKMMAEKLGISKPFYCQLENGTRKLSYEMAVKIAHIFNVKPDSLFYDDYMEKKRKEN